MELAERRLRDKFKNGRRVKRLRDYDDNDAPENSPKRPRVVGLPGYVPGPSKYTPIEIQRMINDMKNPELTEDASLMGKNV